MPRGKQRRPLRDRFWEQVDKRDPGECWPWTGTVNAHGYGKIGSGGGSQLGGKTLIAHRVSWELNRGPIPDGKIVCHKCDNPPCVNPDHLFLGSHDDNKKDSMAKKRHGFGERNGKAVLTDEVVRQILTGIEAKERRKAIAERLGIAHNLVAMVASGRTWLHVNPNSQAHNAVKKRMSRETAQRIYDLVKSGTARSSVAAQFGVSKSHVDGIVWGYYWKSIIR